MLSIMWYKLFLSVNRFFCVINSTILSNYIAYSIGTIVNIIMRYIPTIKLLLFNL